MHERFSSARVNMVLVFMTVVLFSACNQKDVTPRGVPVEESSSDAAQHEISRDDIANASYSILTPAVRYRLTAAGEDFSVRLNDGSFEFSHPALVAPYANVRLLPEFMQYGDLAGDEKEEAVGILEIGTGSDSRSEVVVLSGSEGAVRHIASYLLGHAEVLTVRVKKRQIMVKVRHVLTGDPGPRTTEFVFAFDKS